MSNFKVGDEVWFFWTTANRHFWTEFANSVFPKDLEIEKGKILYMNYDKDAVHVYVDGCARAICQFGCIFHENYFFKSKQEAINTMIERLQVLKDK